MQNDTYFEKFFVTWNYVYYCSYCRISYKRVLIHKYIPSQINIVTLGSVWSKIIIFNILYSITTNIIINTLPTSQKTVI